MMDQLLVRKGPRLGMQYGARGDKGSRVALTTNNTIDSPYCTFCSALAILVSLVLPIWRGHILKYIHLY